MLRKCTYKALNWLDQITYISEKLKWYLTVSKCLKILQAFFFQFSKNRPSLKRKRERSRKQWISDSLLLLLLHGYKTFAD